MTITSQFGDQTEEVVLDRLLTAIDDDIDKRQGSVAYDLTAPASQEFAQAYIALDLVLSYAFLSDEMPSELLTIAASDLGVDRKPSVKASGLVRFIGPIGQFVPSGTQVRTDDGVYFTTQTDATLTTGTAIVPVLAEQGGAIGNVAVGQLNVMTGDLVGIVSVINDASFDSGINEESDEDLLQRVYDKVRKPATSGNVYHYEQMALEVPGVGAAHVYPVWDGPGTVKVVVLSDTNRAPVQSVIDAVVANIDEQEIIGADVTVEPAEEVTLDITLDITLNDEGVLANVIQQIETVVAQYLDSLAFKDPVIRYARIASFILDVPGVVDYANLTLNGDTDNVILTQNQVAILGEVTANEL